MSGLKRVFHTTPTTSVIAQGTVDLNLGRGHHFFRFLTVTSSRRSRILTVTTDSVAVWTPILEPLNFTVSSTYDCTWQRFVNVQRAKITTVCASSYPQELCFLSLLWSKSVLSTANQSRTYATYQHCQVELNFKRGWVWWSGVGNGVSWICFLSFSTVVKPARNRLQKPLLLRAPLEVTVLRGLHQSVTPCAPRPPTHLYPVCDHFHFHFSPIRLQLICFSL